MVRVMFGNVGVDELLTRLNIELGHEETESLESMWTKNANDIPKGKWHCFSKPFQLVCGDKETASKVLNIISPHSSKIIEAFQITAYE